MIKLSTGKKIFVVLIALLINLFIYWCFRETISFENETSTYVTTISTYQGEHSRFCSDIDKKDCAYKFVYHYVTPDKGAYRITSRTSEERVPIIGARKLVKYDPENPNLAFFTKINSVYLFYLIEFALLFVVIWVCFSKQQRKVKVIVDGNAVEMEEKSEPRFYYGQAIIAGIFTFVCVAFYISLGNTIKTLNPITLMKLTNPAGFVLIALLILGIFMTFWSYKGK